MRARTRFLLLLSLACVPAPPALLADETVVHRAAQPDVVRMPADDARMDGAIAEARKSVEEFIAAFLKPAERQRSFAVKVPVIDGTRVELLWVDLESYTNGQFTGRIANEPLDVQNVRLGDRIVVDKERISDWLYVDRGRLVGGFTLRVLRTGMSEEERKSFDASLPFEIVQ